MMCLYAFKTYKSHFACFDCRKTFKPRLNADLPGKRGRHSNYEDREIKCPECGNYMVDLGREFKSPKKTDVKEWEIIKGFYIIGKHFQTCGCNGPGYIPKNRKDYEAHLTDVLLEYETSMAKCKKLTLEELPDKAARIAYWDSKITAIKAELAK